VEPDGGNKHYIRKQSQGNKETTETHNATYSRKVFGVLIYFNTLPSLRCLFRDYTR
jgi:hypothetical protein